MPVSLWSIFWTACLLGLAWFFILSCIIMFLVKATGFRKPSVTKLSWAYLSRWIVGAFLCGLTAIYIFVHNEGSAQEHAWVAVVLSLLLWTVLVTILELLSVNVED